MIFFYSSNNNKVNLYEIIQSNMENNSNSQTVMDLIYSWTKNSKYPILKMTRNDSKIVIQQVQAL